MALNQVLYTAQAVATGGREGTARTSDGKLDLKLSTPRELGGNGGNGTNPEQLFAAGYASCFLSALKLVAGRAKVTLPAATEVTARIAIGPEGESFGLGADMTISAPGLSEADLRALVHQAHQVCPYSKAVRNNIDVVLNTTT